MDFTFSEEQEALAELAEQIFAGSSDADRVAEIEATDDRFDRDLWAELAKANLLGVAVPESHGGLGFGMVELGLLLEQQGRRVAPVPLLPTLVLGAAPIARFGADQPVAAWLDRVVAGDAVLTGAFAEPGANRSTSSSVQATASGAAWSLHGTKVAVPAATVADAVLVPADTGAGLTVFVVALDAEGVTVEANETTNREIHGTLHFDGTTVGADAVVGAVGDGAAVAEWTVQRARLAGGAVALGACEEALRLAAEYTSEREQFGRPLSTNQGVVLRAADCYIAIEGIRLTLLQAAWRVDEGLEAGREIDVAKWWAAEMAQQCVHHVQHLHGGMGADIDYPVHRYFIWVKQLENSFGGGTQHLARLGARIAADAIEVAP